MHQPSDEELVECYRSGVASRERDACINQLFARYHSRVAAWCYRFTGDRAQAADLAQDIFLKVYRHLDSFQGGSKFSTWLFSIARHHCINDKKSRSIRPEQGLDTLTAEPADQSQPDVLAALENAESIRLARELMEQVLDDTEKKVMALHFGQELTIDSITRLLELTNASGARAYIVSAKRKLSAVLNRSKRSGRA